MVILDKVFEKIAERLIDALSKFFKRKPIDFVDAPKIDEISCELVKSHLSVDSFFVLIAHNGKKKTKNHKYKYTSIIAGDYEKWMFPDFKVTDYVYYEIDDDYRTTLEAIKQNGQFDIVPDSGRVNSKINTSIQALGLHRVRYFFLKENEEKGWLWYAVAATRQPNENLNSTDHKHRFDILINKIKNILKNH